MKKVAYRLMPWTSVARPHDDVAGGALDMGTYAANLASVYRGSDDVPAVYARAERFFAATYISKGLQRLLADVLGVLAGCPGDRVLQLRTPFGGGKTHSLLALLHLARSRPAVGAVRELDGLPNPGPVAVAVLSGEELDPLSPRRSADGRIVRTLWGELGAQLGRYDLVAEHDEAGSAPGRETLRRVLGEAAVLVLLDEVLVYVEKAMAVPRGDSTLGRQALLFVQALTEAVNLHPKAAMVYSLQASVGEAVGAEGLLTQLDHMVSRIDAKREPVTGDEVLRVVQRRLFADLGSQDLHREVASAYAELHRRQLQAQAETDEARREAEVEALRLEERVLASYPFHPALLDLMYHRWGSLPSYQRTRGALQFLASAVHALWRRGDGAPLIGPGDIDFSDEATRGAFFSQVGERERYTSVLDGDVVSEGSGAAVVDRRVGADAPALAQLRVGTRMASAIMLFSFGTREGEERGVLESDLVASTLVPGLDRNVIVAALHDLREEELFLHYTGRRYRFEPTPNLTKLVRDEAIKFTGAEVLERVRVELEQHLRGARNVALWPQGPGAVRDGVPAFTFAYLPPDWTETAQPLTDWVEQAGGSRRSFRNAVGFVHPDPAQFDRARGLSRTALAARTLLDARAKYGFTPEQVGELEEKATASARDLHATVGRSYGRAVLPVRTADGPSAWMLEEVDLRSLLVGGRTLHERVLEALSHHVFSSLTVDKLVALAGLGDERPVVRCGDLVEWFYSYFEFTKLLNASAIADAISRGVQDGRFAYAVGLVEADGDVRVRDLGSMRLAEMLPTQEIDLSADSCILSAELARRLRGEKPADPEPPDPLRNGHRSEASNGQSTSPGPAPGEAASNVAVRVRVDAGGLYGLNRALSWLRDQSRSLDVDVTVRAVAGDDGYDQVRLRNGVVEPLEEGGADDVRLELT